MNIHALSPVLALALLAASTTAPAHTTVQVQATEGTTTYNNLVIGHGCATASGTSLPVIAQSVVFPTVNPKFTVTGTMAGNPAVVSVTTLANVPQLIQSRDIFTRQAEKKNAAGQVIGFEGTEGFLSPDLHGLVPFRTAGITFPADSCATRLIVQIAIADICQKNGAKNLWIPSVTPKYSDPAVDGIGAPASLTFNRDLTKNPLAASCGAGYTLTVTPSSEDVDANLRITGWLD